MKANSKPAAEMEKTVWAAGWDGDWFRRAYDDFGHVLGSKENTEGQIFIEPQGICVMAGLGVDNGNAVKALDSVGGASCHAARHCFATTGIQPILFASWRDLLLSSRI